MALRVRANPAFERTNPFATHQWFTDLSETVPDIIEFAVSDRYLNRPNLYPRQATLLKVVFLQDDLFTQYDHDVIGEWIEAYEKSADQTGEGNEGIVTDIYDRIRICKEEGRKWFRESVVVIGRRGSKGYVGGLAGSYVLWNYLAKGNPQEHYGIARDKQLSCQVFGAKKEMAKVNQWKDLHDVIVGSNCFTPYISRDLAESLTIYAPHDFHRMVEASKKTDISSTDMASFSIEPKESTVTAARGVASFMQFYDEMSWVVKGVAKNDAADVYNAAKPALDQFGIDGFMWQPSSPWQRLGQFYDNYRKALERDEDTGEIVHPEVMMIQLPSWGLYKDWERSNDLHVVPRGPRFCRLHRPMATYDKQMEREERANPETFAVERRAHFAAVLNAYLNPDRIAEMWQPWPEGRAIVQQDKGLLSIMYRGHGDPSKSGANFGFAIAHTEGPDERGLNHVVFDLVHSWTPSDFEDHRIDYDLIEHEIKAFMDAFMPTELTFDQYPMGSTLAHLQKHARTSGYPKRVQVYERNATGPLNWKTYEAFKTALGLNLVHAPYHELANAELTYLQDIGHQKVDHPTSGPVQTKDVADTLAIVTYELIGAEVSAFVGQSLSGVPLVGAAPGGLPVGQSNEDSAAVEALRNFNRSRGQSPFSGAGRRRRR